MSGEASENRMTGAEISTAATSRRKLSVMVLGGAVAWLAHLLSAYAAAEFGCESFLRRWRFLTVNAVSWVIIAATLVFMSLAIAAIVMSWRRRRDPPDAVAAYMANLGLILNLIFALVIAVESVPILYYLYDC